MPVSLSISINKSNRANDQKTLNDNICAIEKYVWCEEHVNAYLNNISSETFKESMSAAISLIDVDIDQALDAFNICIKKSCCVHEASD